jgi:phosphatidylserine/phosphatidylglycerophosphate/cardiolipin synthase-like enzyme
MASLHAKVLTADSDRALITSANLTFHGFEVNVEIGVQITGDGAQRLEAAFKELMHRRGFIPWTP